MKKSLFSHNIPTLLGVGILVFGLVVGIIFVGVGPGVFAPRASPQTTPKLIKISNVTDSSFSVSFVTDEAVSGFIKYGVSESKLESQSTDDRDQLSGSVGSYTTHHISAKFLQADTTYYFTLGTASNARFDNNGLPFSVKTAKKLAGAGPSKTAYGTVKLSTSAPAQGALVYLSFPNAQELSTYVKSSGSWSISLSNFISKTNGKHIEWSPSDQLQVLVQGESAELTLSSAISLADVINAQALTLGQSDSTPVVAEAIVEDPSKVRVMGETSIFESVPASPASEINTATSSSAPGSLLNQPGSFGETAREVIQEPSLADLLLSPTASDSAVGQSMQPIAMTVNTTVDEVQIVNTTQPIIMGQAPPNTKLTIEIHSDEAITTTATTDADGGFQINLEEMKKNLSPGEHTITIKYNDPRTGEEIIETKTFTVESQLALASTSPSPFGSGNPYRSPSPSASASATATSSGTTGMPSTKSARPVSGSVGMTYLLLGFGFAFILLGTIVSVSSQRLVAYLSDEE